eukprot:COSAG01_NODE_7_length_54400_cov_1218.054935_40_plen_330_part_00
MNEEITRISQLVQEQTPLADKIIKASQDVIVGQETLLNRLLIAVLCNGHVLLEGVPGLAKTLSIKTLSDIIDVKFKRIQFTPDLLPADIIGTMLYDHEKRDFIPKPGPIFSNFILADEINRAPAKVQSALLEAMQEKQVTIGNTTYPLENPFLVMATQNPIDQEGTYSLPEAQVDRFLMKVTLSYPSKADEREIINRMTGEQLPSVEACVSAQELETAKNIVKQIYVDDKIKNYVVDIVNATRFPEKAGIKEFEGFITFGASPRASIALIQAAKAHAFIDKRGFVTPEDIKAVGYDVLRHRVIPSFEAEAEDITAEKIISKIFTEIDVP